MKTIKNSIVILLVLLLANCSCSSDDNGNTTPPPTLPIATLSNISPTSGPKTTIVTINGNNFGEDISKVQVFFNDKGGTVQSVSNTQIKAIVPARAFTGLVTLSVNGTTLTGPEFSYIITEVNVSTLAGSTSGFADGQGSVAQFNRPYGIAIDTDNNLYIADSYNHKIRKITSEGVVSTLAGSTSGFADGQGSAAQFLAPKGITIDIDNNLYVTDTGNHKIRKITPEGVVSTLAGSTSGFADGQGSAVQFNAPSGITMDTDNNLYVADIRNHKIRKITPEGVVSTLAGSNRGFADGQGSAVQFNFPHGITIDTDTNLYVADTENHKIRKITPEGVVSTLAGSTSGFADGQGSAAQFDFPFGIAIDTNNNLYVADTSNHKIRKITPEGVVSTLAGSILGFADGQGSTAQFRGPTGIAIDTDNNLYVVDMNDHKIRKITQE
ncbi:sugar lactone lactonase YvrE [Aquimarina sp. EL_43]|uniref:IPT/TIG domain-containing protein n=1 Tax=unclassified Aquimarina TaxID=2627091 RepID=UPI0018C9E8E9|nr:MULTISPECIES: IPT/TIG domain-containing protein [unclassified Aquimarina]MBG6128787.1 sugar lactone lactonase YvrE [Aquimarina sp. EL_35]MBG6149850.1 sugar lactone lactonase YvrE [Aquimarina sp. EL_32]MBG6167463.1 sugar lactone lactonase YvrE [Aquimarina sp. EL_43]